MSTFTGFKDYPDISTPLCADFLNALLDKMYPVGKVEVFFDNLDHSDYLGFTWERTLVGRVAVGIDSNDSSFDTIGKTGGSKNAVVVSHHHRIYGGYGTGSLIQDSITYGANKAAQQYTEFGYGGGQGNLFIENTGESGTNKNLQPYQVVAYWKRVEASE